MSIRTDADRARMWVDAPDMLWHRCWCPEEYARRFGQGSNNGMISVFDAYQEMFYQDFNGETPFTYDLRRNQIEAVIAYVNAGANDFNCVRRNTTSRPTSDADIPSIYVASLFADSLIGLIADIKNQSSIENRQNYLNDLVYIYRGLKKFGLNQKLIDSYKKAWPEVTVDSIFGLMDSYAKQPEETRWNDIEKDAENIQKLVTPQMARVTRNNIMLRHFQRQ
ncbi:MAG: hypothetical protein J6Y85_05125 [Alphaproteobacteria bacterium]|nr:hypothetical protein [Alphaproteobacteria bacterium]